MTQLHLTLKPKASATFADPARSRIATCGRRFGKSYLSVAKALQHGACMINLQTTRTSTDALIKEELERQLNVETDGANMLKTL